MIIASSRSPVVSDAPTDTALTRTTVPVEASSEERWAAWVERGRQHDLALQRKARFAIGVAMVAALVGVLFRVFGGGR